MRIFHPVPIHMLPKELLLQEHHNCLHVSCAIQTGREDPEATRWKDHQAALYDRYQKSRDHLAKNLKVKTIDIWPKNLVPEDGASAVYPSDSLEEIRDI